MKLYKAGLRGRERERFKYYKVIQNIMGMETVSIKLERGILKEIDKSLRKRRYSTRTEFIRGAIREKLSELEKEELLKAVSRVYGSSKRKTTDEELHKVRERLMEKYEKKFK